MRVVSEIPNEEELVWDIRCALHRAPFRSLRRKMTDDEEMLVVKAIVDYLKLANWIIKKGAPLSPHGR